MYCKKCGNLVAVTTGGNYTCEHCGNSDNIYSLEADNNITNTTNANNYSYGWVCPICGSVMSPFQSYCVKCTNIESTCTYINSIETITHKLGEMQNGTDLS